MKKMFITMGLVLVIFTGAIAGAFVNDAITREEIPHYTDAEMVEIILKNEKDVENVDVQLLDSDDEGYICYAAFVDGDLFQLGSIKRTYAECLAIRENS